MNILHALTRRHLRENRKRTVITVIGIVLSVAMVTAIAGLIVSFQDVMYRQAVVDEGLWHVRYSGLDEKTAAAVWAEPVFRSGDYYDTEDGPVLELLFAKVDRSLFDKSEAVCARHGIGEDQVRYHTDLLIARGVVPGAYYNALYSFAAILLTLVAAGSVLVISNAFTISADSRSLQFGLLKSTGATNLQIRGMVFYEGAVLAAISIPLGIAVGFVAEWVALIITNAVFTTLDTVNFTESFRPCLSPLSLAVTVAAALVTIFLSAWFPARRAARLSPVEAIRQTRSIRLSRRQVWVSPLTRKLFGFEGLLAAKTLGRNRSRYRTPILSLVVSIVLFLGVSSFGNILIKATSMIYENRGSNLFFMIELEGADTGEKALAALRSVEGGRVYASRQTLDYTTLPNGALRADAARYFGEDRWRLVRLFTIGDQDFDQLCRDLRRDPALLRDPENPRAILLNTTGTFIAVGGKRVNLVPYTLSRGTALQLESGAAVTLEGETQDVPPHLSPLLDAAAVNLIVSDEVWRALPESRESNYLYAAVYASDADTFEATAESALGEHTAYYMTNYEKAARTNRNFGYLVMTFVYGFIAMLSLIGVTSVVTTISTSIALRTREFAMLRSVGMTQPAISKMLAYESLLYGLKALIIGIPLGLLACTLLYRAMTSVMDFGYIWPWSSILIAVAAVFFLTTATMLFARKKQRKLNIAEALRDDVL